MDIRQEVEQILESLIQLRQKFHRYPEVALHETLTTQMIIEELQKLRIPYECLKPTGVVGFLGMKEGRVVALRADIDGLAVAEETGLPFASEHPGCMHACGHDGHIAALLGAAKILKKYEEEIDGQIRLIFQPAEEISAGADLVIEQGYLNGVDEIFGVHIFSDIPVDCVSIKAGPRMAATDHFTITLTGKSGHAAKPHQCVDTTVAAAALVMNLQTIISRRLNPIEDAVVTVGRLSSGTAYNVISGQAVLEGTVRTFSVETENQIKKWIIQIAEDTAKLYGAKADIDYPESLHPPLINNERIALRVYDQAKEIFCEEQLSGVPKIMLGEDFANYQKKIPGVFAFVGGGRTDGSVNYLNHHGKFDFDDKALFYAVKLHLVYIKSVFEKL
ncbi:MAG: amidohydrolase [Lachnospiraceae bacterium]|nr:amidohydrolase [Lachnospiraceae bacterium]